MKYILMFFLMLCLSSVKSADVCAYSPTGHEQFMELEMTTSAKLLKDIPKKTIKSQLKKLKRKFMGTRTKYMVKHGPAEYVSKTIFSRSNLTREAYTFVFNTETVNYSSTSFTIEGSIAIKDVIKIKNHNITLEGEISLSKEYENYIKNTESGKMSVVIHPHKKMTLRIVGDAVVSNGVSKKYFFWNCVDDGAWEVVEVVTTCFELIEEDA